MKDLICHLQVAKAASNSTRHLMQENFAPERLEILKIMERAQEGQPITVHSTIPEVRDGIARIVRRQHELGGVSMMLSFGLHEYLQRKVRYFAFIRDPIARCLSALHFVHARRETHPAAAYFAQLGYRPSALLAEDNLLFTNDQVRIISGSARRDVDWNDLEQAKRNIERHFAFVGNSAALKECWPRLCELTGLTGEASEVRNKGIYTSDLVIGADEIETLRKANRIDMALVAWVNDEYLPSHGIHLARETHAGAAA